MGDAVELESILQRDDRAVLPDHLSKGFGAKFSRDGEVVLIHKMGGSFKGALWNLSSLHMVEKAQLKGQGTIEQMRDRLKANLVAWPFHAIAIMG